MTGEEFWGKAAQWGSYMRNGDPGACMYGFDERGAVQSEQHRAACIQWLNRECREAAKANAGAADVLAQGEVLRTELAEIDSLIAYLRTAPLEPARITRRK